MDTQPLNDRDVAPWAEEEGTDQAKADRDDYEDYKQEREDEYMEAHFAPSEPW